METRIISAALVASAALVIAMIGLDQHGGDAQTANTKADRVSTPKVTSKAAVVQSKPFGSHLQPILKAVNATDEQRKSITEITEDFKGRIQPLRQKHDELRDQFLASISTEKASEDVLATQMEFNRVRAELQSQYLALRIKVMKVLTPEQNQKFAEYRKQQGWHSK